MKQIIIILVFMILSIVSFAQDPREFNHGTCIIEYQNNNALKYYLTWSSAYNDGWEHDIYNSIIYFDNKGNLITESPNQKYIGTGTDEAQEPVNSTINFVNNSILTVWEDGNDNDAPNVRGQMHLPDGTIIKSNWTIAGGLGAQHSANTSHLGNRYLIFYADEAPPSTGGAVLKAKVINDSTGEETQSIRFTPNNEDHWWPVSVSNTTNTRTLIIWGNDGYAARGTVLYQNQQTILQTQSPQDYLTNIQQYFYQVEWLEKISKFILIARNGAYENITDESKVCLIDTLGNISSSTIVNGGILRETKMASHWDDNSQTYSVFYPSETNNLTQIFIDNEGNISPSSFQIINHPDLTNYHWTPTGIWSKFITNINGKDIFGNKYILLITMNDESSNNIITIPVHLHASLLSNAIQIEKAISFYPNPSNSILNFNSKYKINRITVYNLLGQIVKWQIGENIQQININEIPTGVYYFNLDLENNKTETIKIMKIN